MKKIILFVVSILIAISSYGQTTYYPSIMLVEETGIICNRNIDSVTIVRSVIDVANATVKISDLPPVEIKITSTDKKYIFWESWNNVAYLSSEDSISLKTTSWNILTEQSLLISNNVKIVKVNKNEALLMANNKIINDSTYTRSKNRKFLIYNNIANGTIIKISVKKDNAYVFIKYNNKPAAYTTLYFSKK